MSTMKAVVVQNKSLRIAEIPRPAPGPYQCLVKTLCAATCNATDRMFLDTSAEQPRILGHEGVGRVIEAGAKVRNFKTGDLVLRPIAVYPGDTLAGMVAGIGGFSEYGLVTDVAAAQADGVALPPGVAGYSRFQQKLPPGIDPRDATMLITLKETLSWAKRSGVGAGKGVLIFGDGPVGQCFAKNCKLLGAAPVVVVGHWQQRLDRAAALGADRTIDRKKTSIAEACAKQRVVDVVIDAVGDYALIDEGLQVLRERGTYTVYGLAKKKDVAFSMTRGPREWELRFFKMDEAETHDELLARLRNGEIDLKQFYDCVLPMEKAGEAMEKLARREANKVVLEMGG